MKLSDFQFTLPDHLIARYPLPNRRDSRLMRVSSVGIAHHTFSDLLQFVQPGDVLVLNDTKVLNARLVGRKKTGGRIEVLVERLLDDHHLLAQVSRAQSCTLGETFFFDHDIRLSWVEKKERFYVLHLLNQGFTVMQMLNHIGTIPIPPYLKRHSEPLDRDRYQTVYAHQMGSVAAPTAGLHFDTQLLQALKEKGVQVVTITLHVGAGTFLPVRTEDIANHTLHAEYCEVTSAVVASINQAKREGRRVIAVGTTSLRTLETASQSGTLRPYCGETTLFIYPGYRFHCVDALLTNFHLPGSSLLLLVAAFGGYETMMQAYQQAIEKQYRFYSYGDAMWVER